MKTQHTPGPWYQGCEEEPKSGDIYAEDGSLIAEAFVNGGQETLVANARLIAAAPDLLEALKTLVITRSAAKALPDATAAIAKATGDKA